MNSCICTPICLILLVLIAGCNRDVHAQWQGTYLYEHSLGKGAGGIVSFVEYELELSKNDQCQLTISGRQSQEVVVCNATIVNNGITVHFKSYANGKLTNTFDESIYKLDDTLFNLQKNKKGLTTQWKKLVPDGIKSHTGHYFSLLP